VLRRRRVRVVRVICIHESGPCIPPAPKRPQDVAAWNTGRPCRMDDRCSTDGSWRGSWQQRICATACGEWMMERNASGRCSNGRTSRANQGSASDQLEDHTSTPPIPTPSPPTQASLLASLGVMFSQDPPILPPTSLPSPEWADCRD
jgi:hypothetical protein